MFYEVLLSVSVYLSVWLSTRPAPQPQLFSQEGASLPIITELRDRNIFSFCEATGEAVINFLFHSYFIAFFVCFPNRLNGKGTLLGTT